VLVGDYGRFFVLGQFSRLYAGTHLELEHVQALRGKRVEVTPVEGSAPINLDVDGESPGRLPATFEVVPRALRLRF
jgi:diacylglycerol kinase family enzyme